MVYGRGGLTECCIGIVPSGVTASGAPADAAGDANTTASPATSARTRRARDLGRDTEPGVFQRRVTTATGPTPHFRPRLARSPLSMERAESNRLIERHEELGRLRDILARASDGSGAAAVILGEPGIGKSSLLGATTAAAPDMRILRARGAEIEAGYPFGL